MGRSSANVSPQFPRSRRSACRDCKYETIPDITQIPEECYVFPLCAFAGRPVGFCSESLQPRAESGRSYQARRGPNVRTLLGPDILGPAFVDIESFPQVLLSFYWFAAQLCRSKKLKMTSLASRQERRPAHVFKNRKASLKHNEASLSSGV